MLDHTGQGDIIFFMYSLCSFVNQYNGSWYLKFITKRYVLGSM